MALYKTVARKLTNYDSQTSFGTKLRARRILPLIRMIESVHAAKGSVRIVDIGGTDSYWNVMPEGLFDRFDVNVTVVNLPSIKVPDNSERFTFIQGDGCDLSKFRSKSFDIAHSNSVIEHVGDWANMIAFSRELQRVSEKYFVQTPNYWFPIEPHCMTPFFHWLPKPVRVWLVMSFQLGHWRKAVSIDDAVRITESARLINKKMLAALFSGCVIYTERFWLLPKSYMAIKN